jgi:hypothetical protein
VTAQHTKTIEVALAPQDAEAAVYRALVAVGISGASGGGGVLRGSTPTSFASWGENVQATIGHGPRGAVVTLHSKCALPTQLFDWGKNRKNVERIVEALRTLAPLLPDA